MANAVLFGGSGNTAIGVSLKRHHRTSRPVAQKVLAHGHQHSADNRKTQEHYLPGRPF
jgi:hypothetical protein